MPHLIVLHAVTAAGAPVACGPVARSRQVMLDQHPQRLPPGVKHLRQDIHKQMPIMRCRMGCRDCSCAQIARHTITSAGTCCQQSPASLSRPGVTQSIANLALGGCLCPTEQQVASLVFTGETCRQQRCNNPALANAGLAFQQHDAAAAAC